MWGSASAILVLAITLHERARLVRISPFFLYLGDISYSIYLVYFVIKALVDGYSPRLIESQYLHGPPVFVLKVLLTIGFAHLSTA